VGVGLVLTRVMRVTTQHGSRITAIPENAELHAHGMSGSAIRANALWFDLELTDLFAELKGNLVLTWPGLERSWYRWADRNEIPIKAIL